MTADHAGQTSGERDIAHEAAIAMIWTWIDRHPRSTAQGWSDWAARHFLGAREVRAHITLVAPSPAVAADGAACATCGQPPPLPRSCCSSAQGRPHVAGECSALAALVAASDDVQHPAARVIDRAEHELAAAMALDAGFDPARPALCRAETQGWLMVDGHPYGVTDICGQPPHGDGVDHLSPSGETW